MWGKAKHFSWGKMEHPFNPLAPIQFSWNFAGVRSYDDDKKLWKKNSEGWKNYPLINKYNL